MALGSEGKVARRGRKGEERGKVREETRSRKAKREREYEKRRERENETGKEGKNLKIEAYLGEENPQKVGTLMKRSATLKRKRRGERRVSVIIV